MIDDQTKSVPGNFTIGAPDDGGNVIRQNFYLKWTPIKPWEVHKWAALCARIYRFFNQK